MTYKDKELKKLPLADLKVLINLAEKNRVMYEDLVREYENNNDVSYEDKQDVTENLQHFTLVVDHLADMLEDALSYYFTK